MTRLLFALLIGAIAPAFAAPRKAAKSVDPMKMLELATERISKVEAYSATLVLQTREGSELGPEELVEFLWQRPSRISMKWTGGKHVGQEIVYRGDLKQPRITGHRGGLLSFFQFSMKPDDPHAPSEPRRSIADAGIGRLIEIVSSAFRAGLETSAVTFKTSTEEWQTQPATRVQADLTSSNPEDPLVRVVVILDQQLQLPVAAEFYDQPEMLSERYEYRNVQLNPETQKGPPLR